MSTQEYNKMRGSKVKQLASRGAMKDANYQIKATGQRIVPQPTDGAPLVITLYQHRLDPSCGRYRYKQAKEAAKSLRT